jgi:peptidoglycan/LPS O-acetylase OafA/YrhL
VDGYYGISNFFLNLLLLQSWVPAAALTWNYPGWSLSNEAFFYAALPFIGGYLSRLGGPFLPERRKQIALTLFVAAGALWMLSLIVPLAAVFQQLPNFGDATATDMQPVDGFWANLIRYNPLLRLPEFCIGVILARLYRLVPGKAYVWNRGMVFYLPGFALALLLLVCGDSIPYPLMHNGLLVPACALIIFGLALDGGSIARVLAAPSLVFLGNASYCMYILHAPISAWMKIGFVRVLHMRPEGITWFTCYVIACVTISCVFFKTIEDPLHRTLKRRLNAWANGLAGLTSVQPVEK